MADLDVVEAAVHVVVRESVASSWTYGVCCGLASIALSAFGTVLQRKSHTDVMRPRSSSVDENGLVAEVAPRTWTRPLFVLGFILYIAATPADIMAYAMAPQATLAVIGVARGGLVVAMGKCIMPSVALSKVAVWGIILSSAGACFCLACSPDNIPTDQANGSVFMSVAAIAYVFTSVLALVLLGTLDLQDRLCALPSFAQQLAMPYLFAGSYSIQKLFNTELGRLPLGVHSYAGFACITSIVVTGLANLVFTTRALRTQAPHVFVPVSQTMVVLLQLGQSAWLLDEFSQSSWTAVVGTMCGALTSLAGGVLLAMDT